MVASHQKQLLAWEQDRQRVLTLEQKLANLRGKEPSSLLFIYCHSGSR